MTESSVLDKALFALNRLNEELIVKQSNPDTSLNQPEHIRLTFR